MTDTLKDHEGTVITEGRTITNLCFGDDINGLAEEENEMAELVQGLNKASTAYSTENSAERSKFIAKKNHLRVSSIFLYMLVNHGPLQQSCKEEYKP